MTRPFLMKGTVSSILLSLCILQSMSRPKEIALRRLRESIVDMRVAIIPVMNNPKTPTGSTSNARRGKVRAA